MSQFNPSTWKEAGEKITAAADSFYHSADPITLAKPLTGGSASPIDDAIRRGDALCNYPWYSLVAGANEGMTSLGSKMSATGNDYAATEEDNAATAKRFWK